VLGNVEADKTCYGGTLAVRAMNLAVNQTIFQIPTCTLAYGYEYGKKTILTILNSSNFEPESIPLFR
jgi:hypothetical protein